MTRVIACGGRDYRSRARVFQVLDAAVERLGLDFLITGGAPGADALAKEWADDRGIANEVYKAHWGKDGKQAGPIRNRRMLVEGKPEIVIAFRGGEGTRHMMGIARAAGVRVIPVDWDETPEKIEGERLL